MQNYQAKYGQAKVFADLIDEEDKDKATIQQIYEFLNHPAFTKPIAIMPDCHKGNGAVIGFTMELSNQVIPNVIGVDIGCGMLSLCMGKNFMTGWSFENLDDLIREKIPFGFNVNQKHFPSLNDEIKKEMSLLVNLFSYNYHKSFLYSGGPTYKAPVITDKWIIDKCEQIGMDYGRFLSSLGTLGGGNHFIEVGIDETGNYWITFHSGSRQFGQKVAVYHQKNANRLHATGKDRRGLSSLKHEEMFNYLIDMVVAQKYAEQNREIMAAVVLTAMAGTKYWKSPETEIFKVHSVHNFIDFEDFIIRKGAIRSYMTELMVIPFNMEDGLIICEGRSNPEWNFSAPHGAGRLGSRKWAKAELSIEDARNRMAEKGIYCSKLPLDETKLAYKPAEMIETAIAPTAKIIHRVKPLLNCKA
jgi:RNA-splicing ligase RtcB